jgi:hypothetical protein
MLFQFFYRDGSAIEIIHILQFFIHQIAKNRNAKPNKIGAQGPLKIWHKGHKKKGAERAPWLFCMISPLPLCAMPIAPSQGRDVTYSTIARINKKVNALSVTP